MNATAAVPATSSSTAEPPKLTVEMVDQIVKLDDTTLRNLRVTLGYYDLSCRIGRVLGYTDANWCTFAVWASRHAGEYIRGDIPLLGAVFQDIEKADNPDDQVVLNAAAKMVADNPNGPFGAQALLNLRTRLRAQWLNRLVAKNYEGAGGLGTLIALVFASFGQATSHGNTRVFSDVAKAFLPFLDLLEKSKTADDKDLARFLRMMNPYPARLGGQLELRKALQYYALAKFEQDPAQRSRLMFVANGFVGCHEQTRLQDEIPLALAAPIDLASAEAVRLWTDLLWSHVPGSFGDMLASSRVGWLVDRVVRVNIIPGAAAVGSLLWGMFATHWMMALPLPDETLDLGDNLPPLPDGTAFPACLQHDALERAGLGRFLHLLSFSYADTLLGTSAHDWTSYTQRMNTIANLFRSRQQRQSLFRPPFTPAQIALLRTPRSFQIPIGSLGGEVPPFTAEGLRELRTYRAP
jgi:hypothetical protein